EGASLSGLTPAAVHRAPGRAPAIPKPSRARRPRRPHSHTTAMWREAWELPAPRSCAGCSRPDHGWCGECADACRTGGPRIWVPVPLPRGLPTVAAAADYGGPIRAAILAHKERGRLALAGPLGAMLASAVTV